MNPIPLRHKRRTYAWACGRCGKVGGNGSFSGYAPEQVAIRVQRFASNSKADAAGCCLCSDCRAVELPTRTYGSCPACEANNKIHVETVTAKIRAETDARDAHNAAAIAAAGGDPDAAARLLEAMGEMNECHWDSGWPVGCEHDIWRIATGWPEHWGLRESEPCITDELRRLSEKAGGWWTWSDALDGNAFVPMAEWLARCGQGAAPVPDPSPEGGKVGA